MASLYKDKLASLVSNSLKVYGYVLELPNTVSGSTSTSSKEEVHEDRHDFFDQEALTSLSISSAASLSADANLMGSQVSTGKSSKEGPNVNLSSDISSSKLSEYKPVLIGKKASTANRKMVCNHWFLINL